MRHGKARSRAQLQRAKHNSKSMLDSDEWKWMREELDRRIAYQMSRLLSDPVEAVERIRGVIEGLNMALDVPQDEFAAAVEELDEGNE